MERKQRTGKENIRENDRIRTERRKRTKKRSIEIEVKVKCCDDAAETAPWDRKQEDTEHLGSKHKLLAFPSSLPSFLALYRPCNAIKSEERREKSGRTERL